MIKPFANSARASASGPLTWRTWVGLVVLPILVMGLFLWAFWSPQTNHGAATAATMPIPRSAEENGRLGEQGASAACWLSTTGG